MSDFARTIKANVLRLLAEQGVSQNELSRRTGIESGNLARLLRGDAELQSDTVQKFADALGVQVVEFVLAEHEHAV